MSKREIVASSKTYRKATGMVADALGIDAEHTDYPSADFANIVERIQSVSDVNTDQLAEIAEKSYRIGVRGGVRAATDLMAEGHFSTKNSKCYVEGDTVFTRRVRLPNGKRAKVQFEFSPDEIGFTD